MPNTQALIEALSKAGLDLLPYAKYVAFAYAAFVVFFFIVWFSIFGYIVYSFFRDRRDF